MEGIVLLSTDRNEDGLTLFEDFRRELPEHPRSEDADYWAGMALSFAGRPDACRERMAEHLRRYPGGRYEPDATFRHAFAGFSSADYGRAAEELAAYLEAFPGDAYNDEARLLLGDSLLALGEIDEGIASYGAISPDSTRFFEDGWFKAGKALRLTGAHASMREHFAQFVAEHADSSRMAEAVYWIGWAHHADGDPDAAEATYWAALRSHGDQADQRGVADLCDGLRKLHPGDEGRRSLARKFGELAAEAEAERRPTLELHARWAQGMQSELASADRRAAMGDAVNLIDRERHNPRLIADCADFLRESGNTALADTFFADLRKWHPRAPERDRAFLGRAEIAGGAGEFEAALGYLDRLEEELPFSSRLPEAALLRARVLADAGEPEEALAVLDGLLQDRSLPSGAKAAALFEAGEILAAQGESLKATAYFERIYVSYNKYKDLVAPAYLRRGELLEGLSRRPEAAEVYRELAGRADLASRSEVEEARVRLKRLGGDA